MRKRIAVRWGVGVGAAAVVLGHFVYWYWPRERGGRHPSVEAAELIGDANAELAVWLPYPHQNLGRLERFVGDVGRWGALLAGRDPRAEDELPRFGPFAVPPSSEMAVALPAGVGSPRALLQVYPSTARLARAAGRLTGNPWLSGGTVDEAGERTVVWHGDLWQLDPSADSVVRPLAIPEDEAVPLALVHASTPFGPLPDGSYRVLRSSSGLELRLGRILDRDRPELPEIAEQPIAIRIERARRNRLAIVVVWEDNGAAPPIPASAVVVKHGTPRPRLLGEELFRLTRRKPYRTEVGPLEIVALRERDLRRAQELLPALERLADGDETRLVALVDPAGVRRVAERLGGGFGGFAVAALFGVDPARWSALLAPWQECGPMSVVVSRQGDRVRAWLCPPLPGVTARSR